MDGVTPGRIVHFVADVQVPGEDVLAPSMLPVTKKYDHVAAMITGVNPNMEGVVHLSAHFPGVSIPVARVNVGYDETGTVPGSWHWIERA